jgi:hypothetical protein
MVFEVKCAWCGRAIDIKAYPQNMVLNYITALSVSHGICQECKEKVMKSLEITINSINRKGEQP